ncbi:PP2C family protein-serine/threonine phosphatase [Herpetosiphon giganteus]|uniref:PP2C family protein-serine/threonine phosphatase n=1 Tax=Herpetosiphon giganteus TaxID=2029754 RepID=UPI00195B0550|nr:PP2C family protein-serine/threonine phosphatase [Herpetosiphon giganteus]MBM7845403.1 hypothetical protein [Herpetosiphon giganteus]
MQAARTSYTYTPMPFRRLLRWSMLLSTILGFIILIPVATSGVKLENVLITFGSSYSISIAAPSLVFFLLRWTIPIAQRRSWSPIRAWSLAVFIGGLIASIIYAVIFGLFFIPAPERLNFIIFWIILGSLLSASTTAIFYTAERILNDLEKGRQALRKNAALSEELRLARMIQEGLLPDQAPEINGLAIAGGCFPAHEVGGDLLSYDLTADGRLCISVGDVTGKSVSAAMLMGITLGVLQSEIYDHAEPAAVLSELDRWLRTKRQTNNFVALQVALFNPQTSSMLLANAGQLAPLRRRQQTVEFLEIQGSLPLGMGPQMPHVQETISLQTGDLLVFYTDGVVEAQNAKGEMWGFENLLNLVKTLPSNHPQEFVQAILAAIRSYSHNIQPHDDITLVVVAIQ